MKTLDHYGGTKNWPKCPICGLDIHCGKLYKSCKDCPFSDFGKWPPICDRINQIESQTTCTCTYKDLYLQLFHLQDEIEQLIDELINARLGNFSANSLGKFKIEKLIVTYGTR